MKVLRESLWLKSAPICGLLALLAISAFAASPQLLGPESSSKVISVTIWLNQHNKAELDALVRKMYTPGSPYYHHFLTREEYRARYAPTAAEAAEVRAYLAAHHLTVSSVDKFNHYIVAKGAVADVQKAFNVRLSRMDMKGNVHMVTSGAASVPGHVGSLIRSVQGLSDFAPRPTLAMATDSGAGRPALEARTMGALASTQNRCMTGVQTIKLNTNGGYPAANYTGNRYATDATNTCPGYNPTQIQTAYGLDGLYSKGWDGTGQTIVIVDAWGSDTIQQDANTFSSIYGLPPLTSSNFQIYYPGGTTSCGTACQSGNWNIETTLDVEWAHSVAPGANIALVLAPDNSSLDIAEFWAIENPEVVTNYANGDLGYVISNSWANFEILDYLYGGKTTLDTELTMTELGAALGISTNFASGDWGDLVQTIANDYGITVPPSVCMPASSPYATGIGGTSLFLNSSSHIAFQTGWGNNETRLSYPDPNPPYDPPLHLGFIYGAGGGSSVVWPEPSFQSSLGSKYRQVPDISYIADPYTGVNVIETLNGSTQLLVIGGTSLATPVFSGVWAIANQAAGSAAPLGQAAPLLYSLPSGAITDVIAYRNSGDVHGKILNPPATPLIETAADLAQPLENTTSFLSALYHGSSTRWYDLTFGTDSSLVVGPGWDNVTGLGTPNGVQFVRAVVAAVQ